MKNLTTTMFLSLIWMGLCARPKLTAQKHHNASVYDIKLIMKRLALLIIFLVPLVGQSQELKIEYSGKHPYTISGLEDQFDEYFGKTKGDIPISTDGFNSFKVTINQVTYSIVKAFDEDKVFVNDWPSGKKKKVTSFKTCDKAQICVSRNGQYVVALCNDSDGLRLTIFDWQQDMMVVENQPISADNIPQGFDGLAASVDASNIFWYSGGYYGMIDVEGMSSTVESDQETIEMLGRSYYRTYFSSNSENILFSWNSSDGLHGVYNYGTKKIVYSENSKVKVAFFITLDKKKVVFDLTKNNHEIPSEGIGVIVHSNSVLIYDHDGNYFTISDQSGRTEVLDFFRFGGISLAPQPDPISIVADVLADSAQLLLYQTISSALSGRDDAFQFTSLVLDAINPQLNHEVAKGIFSSEVASLNENLLKYAMPYFADWVLQEDIASIAEAGKKINTQRYDLLASGIGNETGTKPELTAALEKLKPLTAEYYYYTVGELLQKGNQAILLGKQLSKKASLLGVVFFETALAKEPNNENAYLGIATAYMFAEQYEKALENYNKCLAISPDYPLALYGVIQVNFKSIQSGAVNIDENIISMMDANIDRFLVVAPQRFQNEILYAKGAKELVRIQLYNEALFNEYYAIEASTDKIKTRDLIDVITPKLEANNYKHLATNLYNQAGLDIVDMMEESGTSPKQCQRAANYLAKAIGGGFQSPRTYYEYARLYMDCLNGVDKAWSIIQEAKKWYPKDPYINKLEKKVAFELTIAGYKEGKQQFLNKHYGEAVKSLVKYQKETTLKMIKSYYYLGFAYYYLKNYLKAAEQLGYYIDNSKTEYISSFSSSFKEVLAYCKSPQGVTPQYPFFNHQISDMEEIYEYGADLMEAGKLDEAIDYMGTAAAFFDKNELAYGIAITHNGLGQAYIKQEKYDKAKAEFETCIDGGGESVHCYANLSRVYVVQDQRGEAQVIIKAGEVKYPEHVELKKASSFVYQGIGMTMYEWDGYGEAIQNFDKSITFNQDNTMAHLYKGFSHYMLSEYTAAKNSIQIALGLDPSLREQFDIIDEILNK